jgi:hypothetical protein
LNDSGSLRLADNLDEFGLSRAAPILKSFVGIGSTTAYAADGDQDGDSQGEDGDGGFDGQ